MSSLGNCLGLPTYPMMVAGGAAPPMCVELVTNGEFDTDLAGWTDQSDMGATIVQSGGQAVLTGTQPSPVASFYQDITVVPGTIYRLTFDNVGNIAYTILDDPEDTATQIAGPTVVGTGTTSMTFMAVSATARIQFDGDTGVITLDNVSVRVNGCIPYGPNLVVNGDFPTDIASWNDFSQVGASFTWHASGAGLLTSDAVGGAYANQGVTVEAGADYLLEGTFADNECGIFVGSAFFGVDIVPISFTGATYSAVISSPTTLMSLTFFWASNSARRFDNISLRKVI